MLEEVYSIGRRSRGGGTGTARRRGQSSGDEVADTMFGGG